MTANYSTKDLVDYLIKNWKVCLSGLLAGCMFVGVIDFSDHRYDRLNKMSVVFHAQNQNINYLSVEVVLADIARIKTELKNKIESEVFLRIGQYQGLSDTRYSTHLIAEVECRKKQCSQMANEIRDAIEGRVEVVMSEVDPWPAEPSIDSERLKKHGVILFKNEFVFLDPDQVVSLINFLNDKVVREEFSPASAITYTLVNSTVETTTYGSPFHYVVGALLGLGAALIILLGGIIVNLALVSLAK